MFTKLVNSIKYTKCFTKMENSDILLNIKLNQVYEFSQFRGRHPSIYGDKTLHEL